MSKFFKALEQAELERALGELTATASSPTVSRTAAPDVTPAVDSHDEVARGEKPEVGARAETSARAQIVDPANRADEAESGERTEVLEAPARPSPRAALELEIPELGPEGATGAEAAEPHLVSLHAPMSFAAEQYRILRHIIEHEAVQVIAVTSPGVGDGKTTTAMNLAGALAQARDARVLVIDCDLRRPMVGEFIGLPPHEPGKDLVDLLLDHRVPLEAAIVTRRPYSLDILRVRKPPTNPYELLKSPRLPMLVDEARKRYHFVILDTPPVVPLPDCRVLGQVVDAFVLIVAANRTPRRLVQEAIETLDRGKILGLILNKDESPIGGYYEYQAYFPSRNGGGKSRLSRMISRIRALRPKPATMRKTR